MIRVIFTLLSLALLLSCLPLRAAQPESLDLDDLQDPTLQRALLELIDDNGWSHITQSQGMAVTLVILDEAHSFRLAGINAHTMIYAASLPKIAVLFAAMVSAQEGDLPIDAALDKDLHDMIRVSCNPCATRVMDRVGRERILEILQRPEYGFYDPARYGGLWVGKDYGAAAAHRRDPMHGLSHGATTFQVAHLYYELATGTLLQPDYAQRMLDYLVDPGINHKFVRGLQGQENVRLWRKSGSWRNFHADSALVEHEGRRYILVALVEGVNGDSILQELARDVHQLVLSQPSPSS